MPSNGGSRVVSIFRAGHHRRIPQAASWFSGCCDIIRSDSPPEQIRGLENPVRPVEPETMYHTESGFFRQAATTDAFAKVKPSGRLTIRSAKVQENTAVEPNELSKAAGEEQAFRVKKSDSKSSLNPADGAPLNRRSLTRRRRRSILRSPYSQRIARRSFFTSSATQNMRTLETSGDGCRHFSEATSVVEGFAKLRPYSANWGPDNAGSQGRATEGPQMTVPQLPNDLFPANDLPPTDILIPANHLPPRDDLLPPGDDLLPPGDDLLPPGDDLNFFSPTGIPLYPKPDPNAQVKEGVIFLIELPTSNTVKLREGLVRIDYDREVLVFTKKDLNNQKCSRYFLFSSINKLYSTEEQFYDLELRGKVQNAIHGLDAKRSLVIVANGFMSPLVFMFENAEIKDVFTEHTKAMVRRARQRMLTEEGYLAAENLRST